MNSITVKRYARHTLAMYKQEGLINTSIKILQKVQSNRRKNNDISPKKQFVSLVDRQNVMSADWSNQARKTNPPKKSPPYIINWIMSPPGGGGGHQNIFRFIEYTDKLGYSNNVYLYSNFDPMTIAQAKENISDYCKAKNLKFFKYNKEKILESDVLFATGWETAYPVFNATTKARKMYFVQDFEPFFYPIGTDYILAENTYRFGFHGITAGGYLADKLSREYGMTCDHYDFAADNKTYSLQNTEKRKEVFFYARPVTERRGFDLGIMALELFHKMHPEYIINLAGWDVSEYDVPFPYVNHKALAIDKLPELYNRCATALVMSLTNMSLLPPELLACGTIPVVNDGPNNRLVSDNPFIHYTEASPMALARAMSEVVSRKDQVAYAQKASRSIDRSGWSKSFKKFTDVLERELS